MTSANDLRQELLRIRDAGSEFFSHLQSIVTAQNTADPEAGFRWPRLSTEEDRLSTLQGDLRSTFGLAVQFLEASPLVSQIEFRRLRDNLMEADHALRGLDYSRSERSFEEGYGFREPKEYINRFHSIESANRTYTGRLNDTLDLVATFAHSVNPMRPRDAQSVHLTSGFRPNTAFIIMRIDRAFDDVLDTVKAVFNSFEYRQSVPTTSSTRK